MITTLDITKRKDKKDKVGTYYWSENVYSDEFKEVIEQQLDISDLSTTHFIYLLASSVEGNPAEKIRKEHLMKVAEKVINPFLNKLKEEVKKAELDNSEIILDTNTFNDRFIQLESDTLDTLDEVVERLKFNLFEREEIENDNNFDENGNFFEEEVYVLDKIELIDDFNYYIDKIEEVMNLVNMDSGRISYDRQLGKIFIVFSEITGCKLRQIKEYKEFDKDFFNKTIKKYSSDIQEWSSNTVAFRIQGVDFVNRGSKVIEVRYVDKGKFFQLRGYCLIPKEYNVLGE